VSQHLNNSSPQNAEIKAWPPKWLTPVSVEDQERGDGNLYVKFAEAVCRVTKDSVAASAGELMILRDWQKELLMHVLARKENKRFKHRAALVGMARKNGKSALGAAIGLAGLTLGGQGSEIYSCAADKEQARVVFGTAKRMIELDPELSAMFSLYRDAIEYKDTGSVYKVLSAEAYTKEGLNPSPIIIFDEVHAQPNRELWDVMSLAGGARQDSLLLGITTAGVKTQSNGQDSLCYSLYQYGQRLVKKEIEDPSFFFAWWEPQNVEGDFRDENLWREANPGYADIVDAEDFHSAVRRTPEAEFRTKRINCFVSTSTAWLPTGSWEALADRERMPMHGEDVILSFDGSFSNDSTALVAWLLGSEKPHLMVIDMWEKPDDADPSWHVPVAEVERAIVNTFRDDRFSVREVVFDPARWNRTFMVLDEEGLPCVSYPNSAERMVPATQKFYEAVINKSFTHDGDERLARHVSNCVTKQSSRGIMVAKASSRRKVDAAVASIFGYDRATQPIQKAPVSQYFSIQV
jgi:phage terminase large subunit-like protein